jgi:hypothetical protein
MEIPMAYQTRHVAVNRLHDGIGRRANRIDGLRYREAESEPVRNRETSIKAAGSLDFSPDPAGR